MTIYELTITQGSEFIVDYHLIIRTKFFSILKNAQSYMKKYCEKLKKNNPDFVYKIKKANHIKLEDKFTEHIAEFVIEKRKVY